MSDETTLDPTLLSLIACPQDKGELLLVHDADDAEVLYNPRLRVAYPVDSGIPILLTDEARKVGDDEHKEFTAQAKS